MDFVAYAERAADLLNVDLDSVDALVTHLDGREWLHDQSREEDLKALQRFQTNLRPVFEAGGRGDSGAVIEGLNTLMAQHPITPMISDHDLDNLHLHVATRAASVADLLVSEALLGLATLVCDLGPGRLGFCHASPCTRVFVDTSSNRSRRYCSERCSSRANVAAFRARQRTAAG